MQQNIISMTFLIPIKASDFQLPTSLLTYIKLAKLGITHSGFGQTTAMNRKRRNSLALATVLQITKPMMPKWDLSSWTLRDPLTLVSPVIYGVFIFKIGLFTISQHGKFLPLRTANSEQVL